MRESVKERERVKESERESVRERERERERERDFIEPKNSLFSFKFSQLNF